MIKTITNVLGYKKKAELPMPVISVENLETVIVDEFKYIGDIEGFAELNEPVFLDFKMGSNTKDDQFVAVFSTLNLLTNAIN